MRRSLLVALGFAAAAVGCGNAAAATGSWVGTFRLPASADAVDVSV
jgi:hypothetical protein